MFKPDNYAELPDADDQMHYGSSGIDKPFTEVAQANFATAKIAFAAEAERLAWIDSPARQIWRAEALQRTFGHGGPE